MDLCFKKFNVNGDKLISYQKFKELLLKITGKPPIYDKEFEERLKHIDE